MSGENQGELWLWEISDPEIYFHHSSGHSARSSPPNIRNLALILPAGAPERGLLRQRYLLPGSWMRLRTSRPGSACHCETASLVRPFSNDITDLIPQVLQLETPTDTVITERVDGKKIQGAGFRYGFESVKAAEGDRPGWRLHLQARRTWDIKKLLSGFLSCPIPLHCRSQTLPLPHDAGVQCPPSQTLLLLGMICEPPLPCVSYFDCWNENTCQHRN